MGLGLTACGQEEEASQAADTTPAATSSEIAFEDGWVKAADSGMSAAFGDLQNDTDKDVTLVGVTSAATSMVELHETVADDEGVMAMQEKEDGFTIEAGSEHEFAPGADHLMMMSLTGPIVAGDEVPFTLTFDDGSTLDINLVARTFDGGEEDYHSHGDTDDMQDMEE